MLLRQAVDEDQPRAHLGLTVAAWLRCLPGYDYAGEAIDIQDAHLEVLQPLAVQDANGVAALLAEQRIFGGLEHHDQLIAELEDALRLLDEGPLEAAVAVQGSQPSAA